MLRSRISSSMSDRWRGSSYPPQTLLAYELPDPLNLRLEVTEDTGTKIHDKTLRETSQSRILIQLMRRCVI